MNTEHLRYLLVAADCQSINKASKQLLLKQQYLSSLIKSLEKQMGAQIFHRHNRGISLTDDGIYLIEQIRTIVTMTDALQQPHRLPSNHYHQGDQEHLHLYIIPQISFRSTNQCIHEYHHFFPNVNINVCESAQSRIFQAVYDDPLALGVVVTAYPPDDLPKLLPPELGARYLRIGNMIAVTNRNNPLVQNCTAISCAELAQHELLAYMTDNDITHSLLYRVLAPYGQPNIKYAVENSVIFFDLLKRSNCFSLAEDSVAEREGLLSIPITEGISLYNTLIFNHQGLASSFAYQSFINMFLSQHKLPPL